MCNAFGIWRKVGLRKISSVELRGVKRLAESAIENEAEFPGNKEQRRNFSSYTRVQEPLILRDIREFLLKYVD